MALPSPDDPGPWLDATEQRTWLAWMRVMLRLRFELNRELTEDAELSLSDYDVLTALSQAVDGRLQLSDLAATIGWERSRLSHHLQRMAGRGLVQRERSTVDGRATDAVLTTAGREHLSRAAPAHVAQVRQLFFGGLDRDRLTPLAEDLEQIYRHLLDHGTLPPPPGAATDNSVSSG